MAKNSYQFHADNEGRFGSFEMHNWDHWFDLFLQTEQGENPRALIVIMKCQYSSRTVMTGEEI